MDGKQDKNIKNGDIVFGRLEIEKGIISPILVLEIEEEKISVKKDVWSKIEDYLSANEAIKLSISVLKADINIAKAIINHLSRKRLKLDRLENAVRKGASFEEINKICKKNI